MEHLLSSSPSGTGLKKMVLVSDPADLKPALNEHAWSILKVLSKEEAYPLEIAKRLGIHEQKVYYHMRRLEKAGLIELTRTEEVKGALAKFYRTNGQAFGIELPGPYEPLPPDVPRVSNKYLIDFFSPFIGTDRLEGSLVVGSPDPHGPFKSWARDGHFAIYLGMFLGSFIPMGRPDFIRLDVDVMAQNRLHENMIIIGGPGVNVVTLKLNEQIPIRLEGHTSGEAPKATFGSELFSERTSRRYKEGTVGYIIRQPNPFNRENTVIIAAGIGRRGTKAAILGLTTFSSKVFHAEVDQVFTRVVQGLDSKGNGEIDEIEVLE